jgi:hypothetical protein
MDGHRYRQPDHHADTGRQVVEMIRREASAMGSLSITVLVGLIPNKPWWMRLWYMQLTPLRGPDESRSETGASTPRLPQSSRFLID